MIVVGCIDCGLTTRLKGRFKVGTCVLLKVSSVSV